MKRKLTTYLILLLSALKAQAQTADTIRALHQVIISAEQTKRNKLEIDMDSIVMQYQWNGSISQMLKRNSALYIRQYGSGTLSTINSLGFNASHNPIVWNNLLLNNPMNGTQDVNLLPLWFIEPTNTKQDNYIFSGTSTSFTSNSVFENSLRLFTSYNSFGNLNYGLKWKQHYKRLNISFAAIDNRNANNIRYFNTYEQADDTLTHAGAKLKGAATTVHFKINNENKVEAAIWYVQANRLLPPSMLQIISRSVEWDKQLRAYVQWSFHKDKFKSIWQTAYSKDDLIYHDSLISLYSNNQSSVLQNQWQGDFFFGKLFSLPVLARHQFIQSTTDSFKDNISQQRIFIQISPHIYFNMLKTSIQLFLSREVIIGSYSPYAQRLLIKTSLLKHFDWQQEISNVFQLPSLNDLYWNPGGNLNLLPERSKKLQSSFRYYLYKKLSVESNTSAFYYLSDNTIVWRPNGSIWTPLNLRTTLSYGATQQLQLGYSIMNFRLLIESSYTFNKTEVSATLEPDDMSLGKPIPYSPQHHSFSSFSLNRKRIGILIQHQYTSMRNSTFDASSQLNAYQVFDTGIRYAVKFRQVDMSINAMVNNLLNSAYQTIAWQAMPGRNFSIQLLLSFQKPYKQF